MVPVQYSEAVETSLSTKKGVQSVYGEKRYIAVDKSQNIKYNFFGKLEGDAKDMHIEILNCNNIAQGTLDIQSGRLNIKYATNGTGKSSVARALELQVRGEPLTALVPYSYMGENPILPEHAPLVTISDAIDGVAVFNEDYVNQYIFQPTDLLANSFEVFIKTPDYDSQMEKIQELIIGIQSAFQNNPELDALIEELFAFISGFGKAQNGYSKAGSIGKGLAKGNKVVNIPPVLAEYTPFIQNDRMTSWLVWQSKGKDYLDISDKCPYCAGDLPHERKEVVEKVAIEYDSKYVAELQKMLEVFRSLQAYFTGDVNAKIDEMLTSREELSGEQINYLKEVKGQVETLYQKLLHIKAMNYTTLKDVDEVVASLRRERIDLSLLGHIDTQHAHDKIDPINSALDGVIGKAGQLQGAINQQKHIIQDTIQKCSNQINSFLESAGYKYQVAIVENAETQTYHLVLNSIDAASVITDVKSHLSYGERNAFALVLFMYRALKENPSLIILDDPISSFDKNKKYAIMDMLFRGAGSFQGKTVIMLTHDFDPVIDMIHTLSVRCRFNPVPVASFLCNQDGILFEKEILPTDVKSFIEIADNNINGDCDNIIKLIYLRRKLEACREKGLAWQLVSNVVHPDRENPIIQETGGSRPMTQEEIHEATDEISSIIPDFNYAEVYSRAHDKMQMIGLYHTVTSNYEKVCLYRLINHGQISDTIFKKFVDEAYHIESDTLFQLDPTEYPTIPDYIVKLCDNGIALLEAGEW